MKGKIEALTLRDFANIFRRLEISDIRVEVHEDGWYVAAVDPANVMIAEVLLSKDAWEEYNFVPKTFAIDVDRLYRFASDFKKGEIVEIVFDTHEMEATFYLNGTLTRTFTLLDEESLRAKPTIPTLEYKIELTLLAPQIKAIKDILSTKLEGDWGNEIGIGVVERTPGEYELCLFASDDEGVKNKGCSKTTRATNYLVIEECASVYSFKLFKSIFSLLTKEVVATGTVTILFAFEYPLKLSYEHKGIEVKQILLAPRVDEGKELTERDVLEELRTPFKPIEEEEKEVEIESTATTLYFLPTAKGRLLKPFKRTEYSDEELIDVLLGQPLPELEGILGSLKLEAIWKDTSYGKYSAIVKEEEISREPADIDAIIKIVENYKLMKYPYLEIREYYKHPEQLEKEKIELKDRVDTLTRYFFGGFGAYLTILSANLSILKEPAFPKADKEEAKKNISRSFAWIMRKYAQIPFSELSKSPFYDDFKPLFEINELLLTLEKELAYTTLDFDKLIGLLVKIGELGKEYAKIVGKYYKELTGKDLGKEDKTRALLEYQSKEHIEDHARWLQEQDIKPNSFEKAAMEYYGVEITEEEPPWRRLLGVIKELEKEHGLEVPEDIVLAAAMEVGIEKPKDLIGDLKRDGILYSPAKGLIARVEREKTNEEEVELPGELPKVFWGDETKTTSEGIMLKSGYTLESFAFFHELAHWLIAESNINILHPLVLDAFEKEGNIVSDIYWGDDLDEITANVYARYKKSPEKIQAYPLWMKFVNVLEETYSTLAGEKPRANEEIQKFFREEEFKVKHYVGYRTEAAYGEGERDLRSVVKHEIEELENTDIIDWTGVSDYIALIDSLYTSGYTEVVWLCKEKQYLIDYYCDGDPTCPIKKYEITDGVILSDLGDEGQLIAYQPEKVKIEEEKEKKGEPGEKGEETKETEPIPTNLIPYEEALRAYEGISQTPERSAEVVINDFYNSIRSIYDKLSKYTETETQKRTLDYYIKEFAEEYATRYRAILRQKAGLISPMVAGPSKFPTARMRKLSESVDKRERELLDWIEKQERRIKKAIEEVAIEEEGGEVAHLRNEIAKLNDKLERMKAINKIVKSKSLSDTEKKNKLAEMGYSQPEIDKLLTPDYMGKLGFPDYTLTSIRNKIKTREERIETLTEKEEKKKRGEEIIYERHGLKIVENPNVDRYQLLFEEKPDKVLRDELKKKGFKWSPTNKAWQRMVTPETLYVIKNQIIPQWEEKYCKTEIEERIEELEEEAPVEEYKEGEVVHKEVAPEPEEAIEALPLYPRKLVGTGLQSEPFVMPAGECVLYLSGIEGKQPNIALYPWHLGHVGNTPIAVYQSGQWRNYFDRKKPYPETDKLNEELQKIVREYKAELAEEVPETPQETIARVMKFKSYTGSRPDWQFLLNKAVNGVDMLKADRYDLMRATGKLLGYNLTPEPSNVGLDRWLAQQLANETGQPVLMIGGSVTVEPEKKAKEPWEMTYREFIDIAGSEYTAGERFGIPTKNRMPINPETGYPIKGATPEERIHRAVLMKALKEGITVPEEVLEDYPDLKKAMPEIRIELITNIFDNAEVQSFMSKDIATLKIDSRYMYRGASKEELESLLNGGKSGGFWSNIPDFSYGGGVFLIAENKYPEYHHPGEIPSSYHPPLADIKAIYANTKYALFRIYPVLGLDEFSRLFNFRSETEAEDHYKKWYLHGEFGEEIKKIAEMVEIPEWENVTKEKLEEIRRTSKFSEKYAIAQAKAAKKVSATEEAVYAKFPDELDLGPYSDVLLYSPVEEIRYLSKAEHAAFIKLVDRGWFQVYRVSKPVSDKYPSGFTYVLKKTREEEKPPEKEILFPPPYELIKKERLSQEELEQLKKDIADLKRARELWREKLPGYEAKQAIAELDRDIADYEAKLKEFEEKEKEEAKAEIEKERIEAITPVYDIPENVYSVDDFLKIAHKTADDSRVMLETERPDMRFEDTQWEYKLVNIGELFKVGEFVNTLYKYIEFAPQEIKQFVEEEKIPKEDLDELVANWQRFDIDFIVDKISRDIAKVNDIKREIQKTKQYYPPSVDEKLIVLDGAHRILAIYQLLGPNYNIFCWVMKPPEEILPSELDIEKEEAKAEIEKRIKPLKPLISEAEAAIDECDKGFETCLEFCDDDLEVCYEECVEAEDVPKCNKECEEKRDKCHDKCEEDALKCYDASAREIIERDIEEGDLTKAEEDLETFMDYVSDELCEELVNRIKPVRPPPSPDDLELISEVKIEIGKGQMRL